MITFSNKGLSYGELWFDEPLAVKTDIVIWRQRRESIPGASCEPFHTLVVDLGRPQETILASIDKGTRYEIRRAADKDGAVAEHQSSPAPAAIESFRRCYDEFAGHKGLPALDAPWLRRLGEAGRLRLSRVRQQGEPLVWHAYYCARGRARLLHSASLFRLTEGDQRSLIGRLNRYLHWQDMLYFKGQGFVTYDLGGWSPAAAENTDKERINRFKEAFGGKRIVEFNCRYGVSLKGRLALTVKDWLRPIMGERCRA